MLHLPFYRFVLLIAVPLKVAIIQLSKVKDELLSVLSCKSWDRDDPLCDATPQALQVATGFR